MGYRQRLSLGKPTTAEVLAEMTRVERLLYFLGIANFAAFLIGLMVVGGGALNGFTRNGHYFVGNHHRYTEVSAAVYHYSQIHTAAFFLTTLLGVFAAMSARNRLRGTRKMRAELVAGIGRKRT